MADPKLRARLVKTLRETLEEGGLFSFHDFTITQEEDLPYGGKATKTTIFYQHASDVYLSVVLPKATSGGNILEPRYYDFQGEHAPGEIDIRESFEAKDLGGFLAVVRKWLRLIQEDLEASPLARELLRQREQIDEIVGAVDNLGDEYFTREEAEQLRGRLDELSARIESAIRAADAAAAVSDEEKRRLEQRAIAFQKDFESLKRQVAALRKQSWLRSFVGRFVMWTSDPGNQKLLETGVTTVSMLLGRGEQR